MSSGDPEQVLNEQFSAIISESTAKKYFGMENPIGKTFRNGQRPESYTVRGVFKDVPANSHIKFDFLLSHATLSAILPESWTEENVTQFHGHLYLKLREDTGLGTFKAKFPQFVDDYIWSKQTRQEDTELNLAIMSLEDIHLHSHLQHESEQNGDAQVVRYLALIATLILVIAWINYVNLSTARSVERAREVGIRKVLGGVKSGLVKQFLFESALTNFLAMLVAILLYVLSQGLFRKLGAEHLTGYNPLLTTQFWVMVLVFYFVGVFLSGLYPAFALSSFKPIQVLRGTFYGTRKGMALRKLLVIFQFAASVMLLIGTTIVFLQLDHIQNTDLGIDLDNSLVIRGPLKSDSTYNIRFQGFKNELNSHASVRSVTAAFDVPGREFDNAGWFKKVGDSDKNAQFTYRTFVDEDFMTSMNVKLIEGRHFVKEDNDRMIMINQTALSQHGFPNPSEALGKKITFMGFDDPDFEYTVIAVFKDYYQLSPKEEHRPEFIHFYPEVQNYYVVKYHYRSDLESFREYAENSFANFFPGNPFEHFFLKDRFVGQFSSDRIFGDLVGGFALLAILVASLGLFGLSSYTVLQKTKEIGVRKVLGSPIRSIVKMLLWQFMKLVILANLIAWPTVYFLMNNWLDNFANRINIPLWLFPIALLLVSGVAVFTVGYHSIRAAVANPVKSLRAD